MTIKRKTTASATDPTDQQLLERYSAGEQDAFELLVQRYHKHLYRFLRKYLGYDDIQDVLQHVWLQLFLAVPRLLHPSSSLSDSPASLRSWLYEVARNRCIDLLRRRKRDDAHRVVQDYFHEESEVLVWDIVDPAPPPEDLAEVAETHQRLEALAAAFPTPWRAVWWLHTVETLSFKDIGKRLQMSSNTAKTYYYRGREQLRTALAQEPD